MEKQCVMCGATCKRRRTEDQKKWDARKCCSEQCRRVYVGQQLGDRVRQDREPRVCEVCGGIYTCPDGLAVDSWKKRKCCSRACRYKMVAAARSIAIPPKWCIVCGVEFERRGDEISTNYRLRETCSRECAYALIGQRESEPPLMRKDPYPPEFTAIRLEILKRDRHTCRICGAIEPSPHVHHVNYQKDDCRDANLVTLCQSCHSKTNVNRAYWQELFEATMAGIAA